MNSTTELGRRIAAGLSWQPSHANARRSAAPSGAPAMRGRIMLGCVAGRQKFRGVLEADSTGGLNWVIVRVPFEPAEVWPERRRLRVRGTINGLAFRTSLFKSQQRGCLLLVNRTMQRGAGVGPGAVAEITLEPDLEERTVATPPELTKLLRQSRSLQRWHAQLSDSCRKAIAEWIAQAKTAESRTKRAEMTAERMLLAMEGERQTPPILEVTFQRQPRARAAWQAMTPVQRRGHLLGIFYYQSPESRQKRAQKAVDEALRIAAAKKPKRARESNG